MQNISKYIKIYNSPTVATKSCLFEDARALDSFAQVSRLGTDKTGTLTKGSFELHDIVVMPGQLEKRPRIDLGIWRVMELQNTMILGWNMDVLGFINL